MELDSNLLKEFAKMTNDSEVKTETKYLRGTIVKNSGGKFVQLDGSTTATPISEIVDVQEGDRVLVTIENHKATIIGNFTFTPSARKEQEAIDKANTAQGTADGANTAANAAQQKAQEASDKADEAMGLSSIASASSDEAKKQAAEAIASANSAQENIKETKDLAAQASADAAEAKQQAANSLASSAEAQAEVTRLQNEVNEAKGNIDNALAELESQAGEIAGIKEEYALSVELDNAKAELSTEIVKKVGELQTTIEKDYATKTENIELEGRLQTQITQNAEGFASQASKIEKLEGDTAEAQKDVDAALAQAAAAQTTASEAQTKAQAAQDAANAATADANTAAEKAQLAQNAADAATAAANAADKAVQEAQGDLDEAKQNLANVTSRVDATEADIANAQAKVDAAQEDVNQALADAAEARLAADNATEAATQAQQDAETAQGIANTAQQKADNAKTAADNAQAAADKAQADVAALTKRVTTAETKIEQNSEQVLINANKTEEIGQKIDNLEVGGRNYILNSSGTEKKGFFENFDSVDTDGYCTHTLISKGSYHYVRTLNGYVLQCRDYEPGSVYTLSYDVMYTEWVYPEDASVTEWWIGQRYTYQRNTDGSKDGEYRPVTQTNMPKVGKDGCVLNEWYHVEKKITIPEQAAEGINEDGNILLCNTNANVEVKITFKLRNLKLEKGNKVTDWTPAPEDIENDVKNNYYSKTETDAKFQVESDRITSAVVKVETVEKSFNELEIGARNILLNSSFTANKDKWDGANLEFIENDGKQCAHILDTSFNATKVVSQSVLGKLEPNTEYTMSGWVKTENIIEGTTNFTVMFYHEGYYDNEGSSKYFTYLTQPIPVNTGEGSWTYISRTFKTDDKVNSATISYVSVYTRDFTGDVYFYNLKLEKGNKPTDWTPAPEDDDAMVNEAHAKATNAEVVAGNAQTTANSAQTSITEAYSIIQQLADALGFKVSTENGQTMLKQTENGWSFTMQDNVDKLNKSNNDLNAAQSQLTSDLEAISGDVNTVKGMTAYVTISKDNNNPYIELGTQTNKFKVRITNTAIDFLEDSTALAYANNKAFYAGRMIVKDELQIGTGPAFVWRTRPNGNMGLVYISG